MSIGLVWSLTAAGTSGRAGSTPLPNIVLTDVEGRSRGLVDLVTESRGSALLVVRVQAEWCGTCRWHAAQTAQMLDGRSVRMIDVLVADADNGPVDRAALARWQRRLPPGISALAGSPNALQPLFDGFAPLPWLVVIDPSTSTVRAALADPSLARLNEALDMPGARTAGAAAQAWRPAGNDRFTPEQWSLIRDMQLPSAPPPDPSNTVADAASAARLGDALFFATRLSPANRACASCHVPDLLFTNGKDVASEGVGAGARNVPTVLLVSHARSLLWDGRADGTWSQAVIPFEDPTEMGSSRLFVAHAVWTDHRAAYERVFGPMPPLADGTRFPTAGGPGAAAWNSMSPADQRAVSGVLANVGKAIAAFERTLAVQPNALDRFASGEADALSAPEQEGLRAFFDAGCAQCHHGPRLSDEAFHNLRFPTGRPDKTADRGRAQGLPQARAHEFSALGAFSDAPRERPLLSDSEMAVGAFRTPGLRGVALTMPYGHGGGFGGLRSVIDAHRTGGLPAASPFAIGAAEPWAQGFDAALIPKIQTFLLSLRADLVTPHPRANRGR